MVLSANELYQTLVQDYAKSGSSAENAPFLVAVSGGVDSMVLLHLASRYAVNHGRSVIAVHVHHGLRPQSEEEAAFVADYCESIGVPVVVRSLNLAVLLEEMPDNLENMARTRRYQAFAAVANEVGAAEVWLGHHADDQLETMLWRIVRGTSLTGLSGMRARAEREGIILIRPLLHVTRRTIRNYALECGIPNVEDGSNQDLRLTRNHLRLEVIPLLRSRHPRAAEHASQLADILQAEDDWLDSLAERSLAEIGKPHGEGVRLDLLRFRETPLPLQRRLIKILLYCLGHGDWTMRHIEAVRQLVDGKSPSARVQLSERVVARRMYEEVWVGLSEGEECSVPYDVVWDPELEPSSVGIRDAECEWIFAVTKGILPSPVTKSAWNAYIAGEGPLHIRTAVQGERVTLFGRNGSKKVQDVLVDAKIPQFVRWTWPVIADEVGIIWIPGIMRSGRRLIVGDDPCSWGIRAERLRAQEVQDGKMDTCSVKPYIE